MTNRIATVLIADYGAPPVLEQHDARAEDFGALQFHALRRPLAEDALAPVAPAGQREDHQAQSV